MELFIISFTTAGQDYTAKVVASNSTEATNYIESNLPDIKNRFRITGVTNMGIASVSEPTITYL